MKKSNGVILLIVILCLIIVALIGFIVGQNYPKNNKKQEEKVKVETKEENKNINVKQEVSADIEKELLKIIGFSSQTSTTTEITAFDYITQFLNITSVKYTKDVPNESKKNFIYTYAVRNQMGTSSVSGEVISRCVGGADYCPALKQSDANIISKKLFGVEANQVFDNNDVYQDVYLFNSGGTYKAGDIKTEVESIEYQEEDIVLTAHIDVLTVTQPDQLSVGKKTLLFLFKKDNDSNYYLYSVQPN